MEASPSPSHRCPVCLHDPPSEPTGLQCGHIFCLECIRRWCSSRRQPKCPLCQAAATVLRLQDGTQEEIKEPETLPEEGGPDLSCLDHNYFKLEAERLLRRASSAQMGVTAAAYGSGRRGSAAADDATAALQQVIGALQEYRHDMEHEVPFDPAAVLHELYSLESIVTSVQAGDWAGAQQQEWAGGGGAGGGGAVLLSADDAAHAADHDAWEDDYSDGSDGGCDEEDALSAYRSGRRLGSMPGRRPVQGKSRRASGGPGGGGGNAAGLASRGSSGSLGGGRRR